MPTAERMRGAIARFTVSIAGGVVSCWPGKPCCFFLLGVIFLFSPFRAQAVVSITISPSIVDLPAAGTQQFSAIVSGSSDNVVSWVVLEGIPGGSVSASGLYSAPNVVGVYHVLATSHADSSQTATATVVVPGFIRAGLNAARATATATLLADGKVLVAGGMGDVTDGAPAVDTAELYDPSTSTSTPTAAMTIVRGGHTATLLPNGKVLIAGGETLGGVTSSAELYDPLSGTFTATGGMSVPRYGHTAIPLPNGKVLITGGGNCNSGCIYLNTAELYDPATGTFTSTGNMNAQREYHTATLLNTGNALIAGGVGPAGVGTTSAELYDPSTGTFTLTGSMTTGRESFAAAPLSNGKVLVVGGLVGGVVVATAEIFDPSSGTFSLTGNLNVARYYHTATLLQDGEVLVAGGDSTNSYAAPAELYNPAKGSFGLTGPLHDRRFWHTATLLPSGQVLIAGGTNTLDILPSTELYDPAAGVFNTRTVFMSVARSFHTATQLADGRVLISGGQGDQSTPTSTTEIFDPKTNQFAPTGSLNNERYGHTAILLNNAKVLVVGGFGGAQGTTLVATAELYDPVSGTFSVTGSPNALRAFHTATLLPNGTALVAGGENQFNSLPLVRPPSALLSSAEIYDPTTGTFTLTGGMNAQRGFHTATRLNNGQVLIAGGYAQEPSQNPPINAAPAEIYDPTAGTFANVGVPGTVDLPSTLFASASTLLPSGKVLLGTDYLFDPSSNTFSKVPLSLTEVTNRRGFTSTLLPNGLVLVAGGGVGGKNQDTWPGFLFSPASEIFSDAGNMAYGRANHSATLLSTGLVLVAGGSEQPSAELYQPPALAMAPSVNVVSPSPFAGFSPFRFTVQGANFGAGAIIRVDGTMMLPTNFVSSAQLTATVLLGTLLAPGPHSLTVTNIDDQTSSPFTLTVSNPVLQTSLLPGSTVLFGSVPVGATASQSLTLTNSGNAPLSLDLISISGADSSKFSFDSTKTTCPLLGGSLPPQSGCTVFVNFVPTAVIQFNANVTVTYEIPGSPVQFPLQGTGTSQPAISISASNLTFSDQVIGTNSAPQMVTISNPGIVGLSFNGMNITNTSSSSPGTSDFSISNNTCGLTLAQGSSCTFGVVFNPSTTGARSASLVILANDQGSPHLIQLSGRGTNFSVSPMTGTAGSATVSPGQAATYQVSLSPDLFSGNVTLGCVGAPAGAMCTVSPNPAMLNGPNPTVATVTVTTTAKTGLTSPQNERRRDRPTGIVSLRMGQVVCLAVPILLFASLRKWRKGIQWTLASSILAGLLLGGCGGMGPSQNNMPTSSSSGTPPGSYQLLVTGSAAGATRTVTLMLNVQ
jgi:hypothetical protein